MNRFLNFFSFFISFFILGFLTVHLFKYQSFSRKIPVPMESVMKKIPMDSFVRFEKIILTNTNEEVIVAVGSGVVVGKTKAGNVIMTNHHVCNDDLEILISVGPTIKRVRDVYDRIFYIYKIRDDVNLDICLVFAKAMKAPPVKISAAAPIVTELVYNISAPKGIFFPSNSEEGGLAPIVMGIFNGYVKLKDNISSSLYTIRIAPGSSGSGLFNSNGELLGLIHSCYTLYDNLCLAVTHKDIIEFLKPKN